MGDPESNGLATTGIPGLNYHCFAPLLKHEGTKSRNPQSRSTGSVATCNQMLLKHTDTALWKTFLNGDVSFTLRLRVDGSSLHVLRHSAAPHVLGEPQSSHDTSTVCDPTKCLSALRASAAHRAVPRTARGAFGWAPALWVGPYIPTSFRGITSFVTATKLAFARH